jgi:hypothetical protein
MWNLEEQSESSLSSSSAALAIRKVTYRALLARRLPSLCRPEGDASECADVDWRQKRVGRLRGSAYQDFPTYLRVARGKLGLEARVQAIGKAGQAELAMGSRTGLEDTNGSPRRIFVGEYDLESDLSSDEMQLSRTLEVLYVLRCLVGPVVESLIAVDRYLFLQEITDSPNSLGEDPNTGTNANLSENLENEGLEERGKPQLVNIFDQSTGSLRNLALVWVR